MASAMGSTVHVQPVFYRLLGACTMAFAAVAVGSFALEQDWPTLATYGPWMALLGLLGYEALWAPYVEVSDGGVTMRNIGRTVRLPWPAIDSVEGKYGLTLATAFGRYSAWAAPAPAGRGRARIQDSDTALLVRGRLEELRRAGHLDNPRLESAEADQDWHLGVCVVSIVLIVAAVVGPLLA